MPGPEDEGVNPNEQAQEPVLNPERDLTTTSGTASAEIAANDEFERRQRENQEWHQEELDKINPSDTLNFEPPGMGSSRVNAYEDIDRKFTRREQLTEEKYAADVEHIRTHGLTAQKAFHGAGNPDAPQLEVTPKDSPDGPESAPPLHVSKALDANVESRNKAIEGLESWKDIEERKHTIDSAKALEPSHHAQAKAQMDQIDRIGKKAEAARRQIEAHHDYKEDAIMERIPVMRDEFDEKSQQTDYPRKGLNETAHTQIDNRAHHEDRRADLNAAFERKRENLFSQVGNNLMARNKAFADDAMKRFDDLAKEEQRGLDQIDESYAITRRNIRGDGVTLRGEFQGKVHEALTQEPDYALSDTGADDTPSYSEGLDYPEGEDIPVCDEAKITKDNGLGHDQGPSKGNGRKL